MALPALERNPNNNDIAITANRLIREFNRTDRKAPIIGTDTGSGAAYVIAPVPGVKLYEVGQEFIFKTINANTSTAPTLAVNGLTAGTITYADGSALAVGDIPANGWIEVIVASVTSGTPTFVLKSRPSIAIVPSTDTRLLQEVAFETAAVATGTTLLPFDDTIPQSNEGDQYMPLAVTVKSASSRLIIPVVCNLDKSSNFGTLSAALFMDSGANALASAAAGPPNGGGFITNIKFTHVMASPGTGSHTFKVRAGCNFAGTTTFNGVASGRIFGGVMASSLIVREVLP